MPYSRELDPAGLGHPFRRPCRRQHHAHGHVGVSLIANATLDVLTDRVERRAARVRRRDVDVDMPGASMRTSRRMPRSAMVSAGISGSGIAPATRRISSIAFTTSPRGTTDEGAASRPPCTQTARYAVLGARPSVARCSPGRPESRPPSTRMDVAVPLRMQRFADPAQCRARGCVARHVIALEEFEGVRPEVGERRLHARVALGGAITEAKRPVGGVIAVVRRFLHGLRAAIAATCCVGRRRQRLPVRELIRRAEELPDDRASRSRRSPARRAGS